MMNAGKLDAECECCEDNIRAIRDSLETLRGAWKLPILLSLSEDEKRFNQISKDVTGISDKMLSKELKELEVNELVKRTLHDSYPPVVTYSLTEHANSLYHVMTSLRDWGILHRKKITGK